MGVFDIYIFKILIGFIFSNKFPAMDRPGVGGTFLMEIFCNWGFKPFLRPFLKILILIRSLLKNIDISIRTFLKIAISKKG